MDVAQYGSGQIVASALDVGGAINDFAGDAANTANAFQFNDGPFCGSPGNAHAADSVDRLHQPAAAPTADLRFLANLISLAGTHPNENKTGRQNASNRSGLVRPRLDLPRHAAHRDSGGHPARRGRLGQLRLRHHLRRGAGGTTGILHAFDAYPAEFLTAVGLADDGIADFGASPPTAYDEVWNASVGPNASAPTVASYGGKTYVFIERADGSVLQLDAVQGGTGTALAPPPATTPGPASYPAAGVTNAPAPVVYEGRVYAGQPNSDLFVYDLKTAAGYRVPVNPAATAGAPEAVCGSPSVGVLADGSHDQRSGRHRADHAERLHGLPGSERRSAAIAVTGRRRAITSTGTACACST